MSREAGTHDVLCERQTSLRLIYMTLNFVKVKEEVAELHNGGRNGNYCLKIRQQNVILYQEFLFVIYIVTMY